MTEGSIRCRDKNGCENVFYYKYSLNQLNEIEHRMIIFASKDFDDIDFFELIAKEVDETKIKIISINKNNHNIYGSKGIPDSAIPELIKISGKKIVSSSNKNHADRAEYRTEAATKFWERLLNSGKAKYLHEEDQYEYI